MTSYNYVLAYYSLPISFDRSPFLGPKFLGLPLEEHFENRSMRLVNGLRTIEAGLFTEAYRLRQ